MTGALPPCDLVLATRSEGKGAELRALAMATGIVARTLDEAGIPESPQESDLEVHATFEENARAKARHFARALPGRMIVADDSGLAVEALAGAPGVHSKRWSGNSAEGAALDAANNRALLSALAAEEDRRARYVCVVVALLGEVEWVARGECAGRILRAPSGIGGFGYDPLFWSEDLGRAFGEVTREEKASVSHRGRAFRALLAAWDR